MNRSQPRLIAAMLVIPAALVLIAAKLTSGATSGPATPLASPAFEASAGIAADDTAYFAGGCFWGVEGVFEHVKGVTSAVSGFSGGTVVNPSYNDVTTGKSGHAETVRVIFDPAQISYGKLLHIFFSVAHDPTQLNRQGPDRGTHYRSALFFKDTEQEQTAQRYIVQLTDSKFYPNPIVTQVAKFSAFYPAEEYHQDYMVKHPNQPYIVINDAPKVQALKRQFADVYRD